MINVLTARNGCKNRQLVAILNRFVAVGVLLIDGKKQRMFFKLRKSSENMPESVARFRPFRQIEFNLPFANGVGSGTEK